MVNTKLLVGVMLAGAGATVLTLASQSRNLQAPVETKTPGAVQFPLTQPFTHVEPDTSAFVATLKMDAPPVEKAAPETKPAASSGDVDLSATPPPVAATKIAATKIATYVSPASLPGNVPASLRQIDALMAPIALYPDQLLSQILMAATYPLEVVEAARWVEQPENQGLRGDALSNAVDQESWDPSVKAMVAFPQILKMMNADLDWLQQVGDAFLAQPDDVMDSAQRLRREARNAGQLSSDNRQRVVVEDNQIIIEPADPDVVYVPFYDPRVVYGVWPYPDYEPIYVPPPLGYTTTPGVFFTYRTIAPFWGWSRWDWAHRRIRITDPSKYAHHNFGRGPDRDNIWRPDPSRRHGHGSPNVPHRPGGGGTIAAKAPPAPQGSHSFRQGDTWQNTWPQRDDDARASMPRRRSDGDRGDNRANETRHFGGQAGQRNGLPDATPQLPAVHPVPTAPVQNTQRFRGNGDNGHHFRGWGQQAQPQQPQSPQPATLGNQDFGNRGLGGQRQRDGGQHQYQPQVQRPHVQQPQVPRIPQQVPQPQARAPQADMPRMRPMPQQIPQAQAQHQAQQQQPQGNGEYGARGLRRRDNN